MATEVKVCFNVLGLDLVALCEVEITSRSKPGRAPDLNQPGEPPEGCEWELRGIRLYLDKGKDFQTIENLAEVPIWLETAIRDSDKLAEAVASAESEEPRGRRNVHG